ncbi:DUF6582 domain-containing protein [Alicyclobacillus sp. ALC3]|uniref:DUF6582 domain-containing protein n=1 Tax=Alicyclobacillus sp. ALC3 TaxID=2796143 RepID=UPI0023798CF2|nr:DUF6582 domain-containing protein [Alicyclobacillus sp. ALC3]WDL97807.1 hypothetical protein JC200_03490 [Alicyclobacillus sp. ALC3]
MPDNKVNMYAPFSKVEATSDGGREVWGFASLEVKDKTGEIADFERTVQAFDKWSSEIEKATQGKSKGNIRYMHGSDAVGKMLDWKPGEKKLEDGTTAKGVYIGVKVPSYETRTIGQIDDGILTGFSIGGNYADRWYDETAKAFRYAPELAETSLVDNPAVPGANFDLVRMQKGVVEVNPDLLKATEDEREKLHAEAEERAKKYGIAVREGGHLTPPEGKPTDAAEYGDPTNYAYPIDEAHIKAAVGYFNHPEMREKGGYTEDEWAIIGKRIAEAANKLIGEGHEFKDGKIDTSEERKDAEKAAFGNLQKRAGTGTGGELSHSDIRSLLNAAVNDGNPFNSDLWVCDVFDDYCIVEDWMNNKNWKVPYTIKDGEAELGKPEEVVQVWQPASTSKGAEKSVQTPLTKTVDPNDKVVDEKIRELEAAIEAVKRAQAEDEKKSGKSPEDGTVDEKIAAAEKVLAELKAAQKKDDEEEGKQDAEKAHQAHGLLKSITDRLAKRGVAVSAERAKHLRHAMDHIHAALGEDDKVEDKEHMGMKDDNNGVDVDKFAAAVLAKFEGSSVLQKSAPDVASVLAQALESAGLAKAAAVAEMAEQLTKAAERIAELEGQVKAIGEQPQSGGPFMGAYPGLGGAMPWQGDVEKSVLQNVLNKTSDPVLKDQLGRHLATEVLEQRLASGRRPTA